MSAAVHGGGMDGSGGDDDKKRKREENKDVPDQSSSEDSSSDVPEETADLVQDEKGLSQHYRGKSKAFADLTDLGDMKTEEIEKKESITNKKRRTEIRREIRDEEAAALIGNLSVDQPMPEASQEGIKATEEDDGNKNKAEEDDGNKNKAEEDDGNKSKSGASASQSEQPMAEAAQGDSDDKVEEMADDSKTEEDGGK